MADSFYKPYPFLFSSRGIVARKVDDTGSIQEYLNLDNCEELAEESFSQRLGSTINNSDGTIGGAIHALNGTVVSVGKLNGISGLVSRYAVTSTGRLYRRSSLTPGAYTQISASLSGNPVWMVSAAPSPITSQPTQFFADSFGMLKDNGTYAAPLQSGIFQPQFPVSAQSQAPDQIILDTFRASSYTTSGISFTANSAVNTGVISSAVTVTGIQAVVSPASSVTDGFSLFQRWVVDTGGSAETITILLVTPTGFVANFTKLHGAATGMTEYGWQGTVAASATGVVTNSFGGTPVTAWPTTLQQEDYISIGIYVSDPTQIQSIQLAFDCGDGSFTENYFYKVLAQGPLQSLLNTASTNSTDATTAATDALLDQSLGLYGSGAGSIGELNTGSGWTFLLLQLSDFAGAGKADFNDPVFNWSNINGYQVTIVATNTATPVLIECASLLLFGGAGPDSFAGVGYDYVFTFYNDNDGTESNPSIPVTNLNPPNNTNWVYPRRQPVLLTINLTTYGPAGQLQDGQITAIRIYRRGGTLGDNYRRVFELPVSIAGGGTVTYLDTSADDDIQGADFVSFTNDVPVTSSLQNPVNNTLSVAINTTNQIATVSLTTPYPLSIPFIQSISVRQQVDIGSPTAIGNNFETVIVLSLVKSGGGAIIGFTAFVQNTHAMNETISATAVYGQPVTGMVFAFGQMWYWGDPNNPSTLYWSAGSTPQAVSSAANIDVGSPDDPITAVIPFKGNLYCSTAKTGFQSIAPGSNANSSPTIYPTACKHGIVAPHGFIVTEEAIYYQAIDGIRAFAGGASQYLSLDVEFLMQGIGSSPIVEANLSQLSQTVAAYWNSMLFFSYIGTDANRHRLILHTQYKRFRNDDFDCQSINLEVDTNQLIVGDSNGLVHIDRQPLAYDQASVGGLVAQGPIPINLQTFYQNQQMPERQKNYQNLQLDVFTAGQTLTITLLFNDGQISLPMGTITNTQRSKINLPINLGVGQQAYKVALQITGNLTAQVGIFQASIESLPLPMTRRSIDTFNLRLGIEDSKFAKNIWWEYTASAPIVFSVYYDDNPTAGFTFTLPTNNSIRNHFRQRLPAVSFRDIRVIGNSTGDFMIWTDSKIEFKPQGTGKGYQVIEFVPN